MLQRKNKKAQFYLFTMVILIALATLLVFSDRLSVKPDSNFNLFLENIDREAEYVINNALKAELDTGDEMDIFLQNMAEVGVERRIELNHFYLIVNGTMLRFSNGMQSSVFLIDQNATIPVGGTYFIDREDVDEIAFRLDEGLPYLSNFIYKFYITEEENQVLYLLFTKRGEQHDIYVRDNSP